MLSSKTSRSLAAVAVSFAVALVPAFAVASARAAFGSVAFDGQMSASAAGEPLTQAGGHPYEVATQIELNHHFDPEDPLASFGEGTGQKPDATVKDIAVELPPGLVGDPPIVSTCTSAQLAGGGRTNPAGVGTQPTCPVDSQVGVVTLFTNLSNAQHSFWAGTFPIYNMVAPPDVPGRLGLQVEGNPIVLDASVRSNGDYGLTVTSTSIPAAVRLWGVNATLWGVPADPSHDAQRCDFGALGFAEVCPGQSGTPEGPHHAGLLPRAFLRSTTACTAPGTGLEFRLRTDSWENPGVFQEDSFLMHAPPNFPAPPEERGAPIGVGGCENVPFTPSIQVTPTNSAPDSPSGLDVTVSIPQEGLTSPTGIGQSDLKRTAVMLPEGVVVNPSAAGSLGACTPAQIDLRSVAPANCPGASRLGTVEIRTPALADPLEGSVYLARQGENPFGSLLAVYIVVEGHGVVVKVAGRIDADPIMGRLTATLDDLPQQSVSSIKLALTSGPRSALTTPMVCGDSATKSSLEGWSGKSVVLSSPYSVDCAPGLGGFSPSFLAGTVNPQAGAFSPFTVTLSRRDGEQQLGGLTVRTPPGLLGVLKSVARCPEPQASQGTCGEDSLIGHVTAAAGAGPDPMWIQGGKAYLTGPYKGSPFGLSVAVPAKAGPFDLGTVVVRSRVDVDPHTSQVTITSDPFPTILQGVPLQIRTVNVTVDRSGFIFNPTNCSPLSVDGTITSTQGATANVSSHFQAANCAALSFHPSFRVSTQARTSKTQGASLDVKVASGQGQANIGKTIVSLPKQLPARLTTIQQACPAATFAQNPASCPAASAIGIGTATTPILATPVTGPAYLVSHGGAAFPDVVVILQGEGVTVDLVGGVNIKGGITSATFNDVPDVPIGQFELRMPEGPHSGLAANLPAKARGSMCGQKLVMPTTITGQNGAVIKQNTKIAVTGCPKSKKKPKHTRTRAKAKRGSLRGRK